jgi:hypothetical protein
MTEAHRSSNPVAHLREVADRLCIRGDYGNGWSDVADATACTIGAAEIERLTEANRVWEVTARAEADGNETRGREWDALRSDVERLRAALEIISTTERHVTNGRLLKPADLVSRMRFIAREALRPADETSHALTPSGHCVSADCGNNPEKPGPCSY